EILCDSRAKIGTFLCTAIGNRHNGSGKARREPSGARISIVRRYSEPRGTEMPSVTMLSSRTAPSAMSMLSQRIERVTRDADDILTDRPMMRSPPDSRDAKSQHVRQ